MTIDRRARRIAQLKRTGSDWDTRTAEYMQADPTMTEARAKTLAHDHLVREMDARWRAEDPAERGEARPVHWGEDPRVLAIVGLD
jgi:hypothetical protein